MLKIRRTRIKEDNRIIRTQATKEVCKAAATKDPQTKTMPATHLTKRTTATSKTIHTTTETTIKHKTTGEARSHLLIRTPLCRIKCTSSSNPPQQLQPCPAMVDFSLDTANKVETSCLKTTLQTVQWALVWTTWMSSLGNRCRIKRWTNSITMRNHESHLKVQIRGSIPKIAKMVATIPEVTLLATTRTFRSNRISRPIIMGIMEFKWVLWANTISNNNKFKCKINSNENREIWEAKLMEMDPTAKEAAIQDIILLHARALTDNQSALTTTSWNGNTCWIKASTWANWIIYRRRFIRWVVITKWIIITLTSCRNWILANSAIA